MGRFGLDGRLPLTSLPCRRPAELLEAFASAPPGTGPPV
jgi:hypothetical protein